MITIDIDKAQSGNVLIGRQGEHDFSRIHFVMGQWAAQYPAGSVSVVYERPDGETYPVVTAARPAGVVWQPNLADLSVAGAGRLECRLTTAVGLGKSATIPVAVAPSLNAVGSVPVPPIPDWTYTVAENAARAEKAAADAETASEGIQEMVQAELTAAKESGEFDGPQGDTGAPFTYDMFTAEQLAGLVGPQGETGPAGPKGDPGQSGYTPEKGKDYFTEADKAEMVEDVLAAMPVPDVSGQIKSHNEDPEAHEVIKGQMQEEMLRMLTDLGLVRVASSDGSVLYTSNDGKIYVL